MGGNQTTVSENNALGGVPHTDGSVSSLGVLTGLGGGPARVSGPGCLSGY